MVILVGFESIGTQNSYVTEHQIPQHAKLHVIYHFITILQNSFLAEKRIFLPNIRKQWVSTQTVNAMTATL